jgi:predicted aspartyl protease
MNCRFLFHRIAAAAALYCVVLFFPSAKALEKASSPVELRRSTGNHLLVPVRVNNQPAWFAVDTGAALTIVDTSRAKSFGLVEQNRQIRLPRQIEVNNRSVPVAIINSLTMGNRSLGTGPVALVDLRGFGSRLAGSGDRVPMDGIIGLDILEHFNAVIDCTRQRIYFPANGREAKQVARAVQRGKYRKVPLTITRAGALEVVGRLGPRSYSFVVDTGGFATLIPSHVAAENGIPIVGSAVKAKGIHSSERSVGVAIAPEFEVGKHGLGPTVIGVTGLPEGPDDLQYPFGGLIGADFLFERGGIIDIGNRTLYFR